MMIRRAAGLLTCALVCATSVQAQQSAVRPTEGASRPQATAAAPAGVVAPLDYQIGTDDVLTIVFWREKDLSSEVVVRPDGKITLPLLNDIVASGLTPEELRAKVEEEAERYIEDPAATVVVKQINSRKVFITGEINKPGPYVLTAPTTVMQLIATAGGLREFARRNEIVIMRLAEGRQTTVAFDYDAVVKQKKVQQNILLQPGDTIVVP
jgi:polysaccharide export outer membrane protein